MSFFKRKNKEVKMVLEQDNLIPIGGTIFYIDTSAGGEYKFYDNKEDDED